MEENTPKNQQNVSWWIISLAISIVCSAIMFVVFASYVVNVKEVVAINKVRLDMAEQRLGYLSNEVDILRHRTTVQQIQIMPPAGTPPTVEGVVNAIRGQGVEVQGVAQQPAPAQAPVVVPAPAPAPAPAQKLAPAKP